MICSETNCGRSVRAKGLCTLHYSHMRYAGLPNCSVRDCDKQIKAIKLKLCSKHYNRYLQSVRPSCIEEDCNKPQAGNKLCQMHYRRTRNKEKPKCIVDNCEKQQSNNKMCSAHYNLDRKYNGTVPCKIIGCTNYLYGLGMCTMHYQRYISTGDAGEASTKRITLGMSVGERFWFYVDRLDDTEVCWKWTGRTDDGYGLFDLGSEKIKSVGAHRYSFAISNGIKIETLGKMHVHHKCSERDCVNPNHLELITNTENVGEMFARNDYITAISLSIEAIEKLDSDNETLKLLKLLI